MTTPNEQAKSNFPRAKVSYNPQRNIWTLEEEYHYCDETTGTKFILDKGFEFDLSSIPRVFWRMVAIHELSLEAPLIHDFMYMSKGGKQNYYFKKTGMLFWQKKTKKTILGRIEPQGNVYSREEADDLFLKMMEQAGVSKWRRLFGYVGVRLGGGFHWKPEKTTQENINSLDDKGLSFN